MMLDQKIVIPYCKRCGRELQSKRSISKGYGPGCMRKKKLEAMNEIYMAGDFNGEVVPGGIQLKLK